MERILLPVNGGRLIYTHVPSVLGKMKDMFAVVHQIHFAGLYLQGLIKDVSMIPKLTSWNSFIAMLIVFFNTIHVCFYITPNTSNYYRRMLGNYKKLRLPRVHQCKYK